MLGDITHCPAQAKKAETCGASWKKHLRRVGLSTHDVVSGVGDGGGENEGVSGIHHSFEQENASYVRRRCLPHIAWRTADQAINEALSLTDLKYRGFMTYLREGITWTRLRDIAVRSPADGGLALFADGGPECQRIFGERPDTTLEGRPETDLRAMHL